MKFKIQLATKIFCQLSLNYLRISAARNEITRYEFLLFGEEYTALTLIRSVQDSLFATEKRLSAIFHLSSEYRDFKSRRFAEPAVGDAIKNLRFNGW